ncbi:MAG TPA: hypothetical protein VIX59_17695 [Candidatus Binataceae bacterium]
MRIEGLERKQAPWILRPLYAFLKRQFGKELTPYKIWAYRPGILVCLTALMGAVEYSKGADSTIKQLVSIRAAQVVGCPF